METLQEIARTLRSTEKMATAFVSSIREKVGQDVPDEVVLIVLKKLNPRSIDISRVVAAVRQEMNREKRRSGRQATGITVMPIDPKKPIKKPAARPAAALAKAKPVVTRTMMEQLEELLTANWNRAEREGFEPERMTALAFVSAVHRHSDPRDATRTRILRACQQVDQRDVLITPTMVADIIRGEL